MPLPGCFAGLVSSFCGEDPFYRDAFFECRDIDEAQEYRVQEVNLLHQASLFVRAREQAQLKTRKGSVFASFAGFEFWRRMPRSCPKRLSLGLDQTSQPKHLHNLPPQRCRNSPWVGRTLPQRDVRGQLGLSDGPCWSKGTGLGLNVRCGPNFAQTGLKTCSAGSLYECLSCDAICADTKIEDIVGRLVPKLPAPPATSLGEGDMSAGGLPVWSPGCRLPRVICINLKVPHNIGISPWSDSGGSSFVCFFHIRPETVRDSMGRHPSPGLQLFRRFWEGPAGAPHGPPDDPNRSLARRMDEGRKKDRQSGLFKAIAFVENPDDVEVPGKVRMYNGKPALITKSGYVTKDPNGEWLEIGIDIRGFSALARTMLYTMRESIPLATIHFGFLVQAVEDDEMPEMLLGDLFAHGIDICHSPWRVDNE